MKDNDTYTRMTGRSTRLIDKYIQLIFNNPNEGIFIEDHFPTKKSDKLLFNRVFRRLKFEHRHQTFKFNALNNTVTLID